MAGPFSGDGASSGALLRSDGRVWARAIADDEVEEEKSKGKSVTRRNEGNTEGCLVGMVVEVLYGLGDGGNDDQSNCDVIPPRT